VDSFATNYNSLLYSLKTSQNPKFSEIFSELNAEGYTDSSKVPILGAIVYGTKDQLKSLVGNPHIKASSFGVIVDKY
ncbi:MAG: anti sigma factor C-terminal domain-containing protein, partial [Dehalococcoidales bacterium]|nr:anti sigma factor C-terminal domain-containing protein [Dehalococcoidales bacterium]